MGTDVRHRGRQVHWTVPGDMYEALRKLHTWALEHFPPGKVPTSEEEFCLGLLLSGYEKSEENRRKWEEATGLIVSPKQQIVMPGGLIAR